MKREEPNAPVIEVSGVSKSFRKTKAVRSVDLQIYHGEFVALLGPNGAGKTTLLEMIEGIQEPDSGAIHLLNTTWRENELLIRKKIGLALQETRFPDRLTVVETLKLFGNFHNCSDQRCEEVLRLTGLQEKRKTQTMNLSGGQRQRLALGIAIVNEPEILLLDEPTTGLDPNARRDIWNILKLLKQNGSTMILTTHYMEEAEALCDRIIFMNEGQLLAQGSLTALQEQLGNHELIEFELKTLIDTNPFHSLNGFRSIQRKDGDFRAKLFVDSTIDTLPDFLQLIATNDWKLQELQCRKQTLDDLFIQMTGRHLND